MINIHKFYKILKLLQIKRLKRKTQINNQIDLFEDRKREIAEYYNLTTQKILEIHEGPNQHEIFTDISTDKKLLSAYRE